MGGACKNCSAIPLSSSRNDVVLTSSMGFCCKVILNDEFLHHLFIPPRFARKIAPLTNKNVQIKDINGRSWTVKLSYVRGALAFASGWRSFTRDHGIKPHNQVLFIYISDSNFLCQIFGINSSKKWRFPSACNNRPSSSCANEDSSDGNITQINKEGSPLAQGKGVKRKYCEDPCYIVYRDSDFDQNEDRRCFLDISEFEMHNSLLISTNGSSTAQDADIEERINDLSFVEDCFNLPIFEEDMRIPCEGGEDFGSSLLESFPSTLAVSGTEKHVVAFAQIAPFEEPSVVAQSADLYPRTAAVQGPSAEAKAADLKPQTTEFKGQTHDVTGLEVEGQTETADFNCQKTAFQGPAMEALKTEFSGQTTTHMNQDAAKKPRESEPKVFGNERATFGGSVGIAKNEQKGLNPQGFCYKVSENNLDAAEEPRESKAKDFGNETTTIGGRVRTPKIEQKGQNEKGFDGSAKTAHEEPNKLNPQGLGGSVGHVKIERKNFRPNGFGGRMRIVKEEPNIHLNTFDGVKEPQKSMAKAFVNEAPTIGGRVRTAKIEQKGLNQQGLVGSAKIAKEEQNRFNLQGSGGSVRHVKIERKNLNPNGFGNETSHNIQGGRMRIVKEEPKIHLNSFDAVKEPQKSMAKAFVNEAATIGGRVRTAKIEQKGLNQQGLVGSAKIAKEEQNKFNLQGSGGSVRHVKIERKNLNPNGFATSNSYQALKKVKIEAQDFTQPPPTVTCAVTSDSNFLMLPKKFSSLRTDMCVQSKVEFFKDSAGRLWPVMCCKKKGQQGLTAGWKSIRDANGIRIGDECVFSHEEDYHQGIINMNVVQK